MTTLGSYVPESVTTSLLSQSVDLKYDYRTKQLMNEAQPNSSEEVQLSYNDIAEIDPSRLQIDESQVIGGGCFGLVIKGFLDGEAVAVKVASKGRNGSACLQFEIDGSITITKDPQLSTSDLLSFAYQTAKGMQFLSSKQYVHRDLATRNLLVKKCESEWIVKICDFGLAKEIREAKSHYSRNGFAQPLNWMSPEAYAHKKADVWSFGIGLYELFSLGGTPYGNKTEQEIQKELSTEKEKLTTKRPPYCHQELFNFIECFWYYDASRRPSFENCVNELKSHLQRANPQKLKRLDGIND
ncbi:unnamed protein product, partial [Mesorhabditis belari]|uniref:Protein kinase domain-containing protein n=1 Tax=Mesorhabditis belari TaxID=2138241 RepID=A0AAF3FG99_9BILA